MLMAWGRYGRRDDRHELIFSLLYEAMVAREKSFYWPYLRLLPKPEDMDIPLMWSDDEIDARLGPSVLQLSAKSYKEKAMRDFETMEKIDLVSDFFKRVGVSFAEYRWAYAILDSRSIW